MAGHKQEISVSFFNDDQMQAGIGQAWALKCPCLPDYERRTLLIIADVDRGAEIHTAMTNIVNPPPVEPAVPVENLIPSTPTTAENMTPPDANNPAPAGDGVPS